MEEAHRNTPIKFLEDYFSIYREGSKSIFISLQKSKDPQSPYAPLAPPGWSSRLAATETEAQPGSEEQESFGSLEGGREEKEKEKTSRASGSEVSNKDSHRCHSLGSQNPNAAGTQQSKPSRGWAQRQPESCVRKAQ